MSDERLYFVLESKDVNDQAYDWLMTHACDEWYGSCLEAPAVWAGRAGSFIIRQTGYVNSSDLTHTVYACQTPEHAAQVMRELQADDICEFVKQRGYSAYGPPDARAAKAAELFAMGRVT